LPRGRILITSPEGRTERIDLKNIWGIGGVNLNNLAQNDRVMQTLFEDLLRAGWRLANVMPVPGDEGQLFTRYIYSRCPNEIPAIEQPVDLGYRLVFRLPAVVLYSAIASCLDSLRSFYTRLSPRV
jgi:hypothetical protein